ncbi:hypothetical protein [Micromonospora carbonacea]|uniref:hypothetical protein n=1 Tax=Micromonospora carbonacea TaxID=47853 RepID=UPI003721FCFF
MPTINWDTVATAAATAMFVTLAVEYAAKPRLEARKERILDGLRSRNELVSAIANVSVPAGLLTLDIPKEASADVRQNLLEERRRQYERLRNLVQSMQDNAVRHVKTYPVRWRGFALRYIACVQGVMLSARTQHRKAELIMELSIQMVTILEGRWWRPMPVVRAAQKLDQVIRETEEPAEKPSGDPPVSG